MKLYREYKINPAGGCLPMVLQLPIFFGVYQAVINLTRVSVAQYVADTMIGGLAQAGVSSAGLPQGIGQPLLNGNFLWLPTLGVPDPLYILPVLSVVLQLIVQLMATPRVQDPQQKAMMQSMLIMPVVFGYIGFTFPSGAVLYWVVGSVLSIIQQYVISGWGSLANYLKFLPADGGLFPPPIPAAASAGAAAGGPAVSGVVSEPSGPRDFWDLLKPLTESAGAQEIDTPSDAGSDEGATDVRRSSELNVRRRRSRR
jgi:YidC/Oxa1 family membrane protein insertase